MEYAVSREGTTLVTLHGGSDTTACDDATDQLADALEGLEAESKIVDWEIAGAKVYEHPTAPFDPYTIAVEFRVVTAVEARDTDEAADRGGDLIDDALASADVDAVSYAAPPAASS
jgi:hypothetical protein